jgi:hypothetical protein
MEAVGLQVMASKVFEAFAALAKQLPWPERLKFFASALKYPTVYSESMVVLLTAIKEHPAATTVRSSGDLWAVVEWLNAQPNIDVTTPPIRPKVASR